MAIKPDSLFVGKIAAASTNYPLGSARNITTPGDGTGTPFLADLVNDTFGFYQAVLAEAGITPSENPDTAINSQYLDGLKALFYTKYGLGPRSAVTNLAQENVDDVTGNGFFTGYGGTNYYASTGDNPFPSSGGAFSLISQKGVNTSSDEYLTQIAISLGANPNIKVRTRVTAGWSDWVNVFTSGNVSTFAQTILDDADAEEVRETIGAVSANPVVAPLELIAHRGFKNSFPQNTMLALTSAMERGADSLECDVQITSDGVPVVFHDSTVDSLTNGSGTIASKTLVEVQALVIDEVAGTALSSVRIPEFSEVLKYCKGAGVKLYPEIKEYRTQADIQLMLDEVVSSDMERLCFFSTFDMSDVQFFRTLNTTIDVGFLNTSNDSAVYEPRIDTLAALGNCSFPTNYAALLTAPDIVTYARDRGVDVHAWTVNDNTDAKKLMRIGVYKIMSDTILEVL